MRVLIHGSSGNMGRRYAACVRWLGHDVIEYDIRNWRVNHHPPGTPPQELPGPSEYDLAIVCTPPDLHCMNAIIHLERGKPTLVEKPLSKIPDEVANLRYQSELHGTPVHMVNNWSFALSQPAAQPHSFDSILIDNYNTGSDGSWDYCQPAYLLRDPSALAVRHGSPVPTYVAIDGARVHSVGTVAFEMSYLHMIRAFIDDDRSQLWPITDDLIDIHKYLETLELTSKP